MNKPWFRLNKWKKGWVPIAWQGWILLVGFVSFTTYNFFRIDASSHSVSDTLIQFIPQTLLFAGLLSVLCYFKSEKSSGENMLQ